MILQKNFVEWNKLIVIKFLQNFTMSWSLKLNFPIWVFIRKIIFFGIIPKIIYSYYIMPLYIFLAFLCWKIFVYKKWNFHIHIFQMYSPLFIHFGSLCLFSVCIYLFFVRVSFMPKKSTRHIFHENILYLVYYPIRKSLSASWHYTLKQDTGRGWCVFMWI